MPRSFEDRWVSVTWGILAMEETRRQCLLSGACVSDVFGTSLYNSLSSYPHQYDSCPSTQSRTLVTGGVISYHARCTSCPTGSYYTGSNSYAIFCEPCPLGSNATSTGQSVCDCVAGYWSSTGYADGSILCEACRAGEHRAKAAKYPVFNA